MERSVLRLRYEHLLMNGWRRFKPSSMVNWWGHGQEFIPWPEADVLWALVPVSDGSA